MPSKKYQNASDQFTGALMSFGTVAVLAGAMGMAAAMNRGAIVGDILVFEAMPHGAEGGEARIVVHRPGQYGCVLDLATIRQGGGSLVVEARLASEGDSFRVHWAGERTTTDSGNCGSNADLIMSRQDLDSVAMQADRPVRAQRLPRGLSSMVSEK
jgi:hypothetical protein